MSDKNNHTAEDERRAQVVVWLIGWRHYYFVVSGLVDAKPTSGVSKLEEEEEEAEKSSHLSRASKIGRRIFAHIKSRRRHHHFVTILN